MLKTSSKIVSQQVQQMLSVLGIRSYITTNKATKVEFNNGIYTCKESYDVNISKDIQRFIGAVGFLQNYKNDILKTASDINYSSMYTSKIETKYLGDFEVFDITVDNQSHTYWTGGLSVSNCAEQSLANAETCCLAEIFLPNIETYEEFIDVAKLLYRVNKHSLALPCHQKETEKIVHKNMRMGIGVTGYLQATPKQKKWLDKAYQELREFDVEYSKQNNFPPSIKLTTVKPSGTAALLPGVTPGCHPGYAQYMIRRISISSIHPLVKTCQDNGYPIEYRKNFDGSIDYNTTIVSFPYAYPIGTKLAKDMTAIDQLKVVKELQENWSDNAVSCTIYYEKEELPEIKKYLSKYYKDNHKTLSFLLHSEHGFLQAPYTEITKDEYDKLVATTKIITSISDGLTLGLDENECSQGVCPIR